MWLCGRCTRYHRCYCWNHCKSAFSLAYDPRNHNDRFQKVLNWIALRIHFRFNIVTMRRISGKGRRFNEQLLRKLRKKGIRDQRSFIQLKSTFFSSSSTNLHKIEEAPQPAIIPGETVPLTGGTIVSDDEPTSEKTTSTQFGWESKDQLRKKDQSSLQYSREVVLAREELIERSNSQFVKK